MPIKKLTYFMLLLIFTCTVGKAQVSSMGTSFLSGNGGIITTPTMPVSGSAKCLSVGGYASALNIANNGTGLFGSGCTEKPPVADTTTFSLSLNVYPNPTRGSTILKATGDFDEKLSCLVKVIAMDGKILLGQMVPMKDVKKGYMINGNAWAAGNYTVMVELMNKRYSLRLIKL
jgi:hypothetical protein